MIWRNPQIGNDMNTTPSYYIIAYDLHDDDKNYNDVTEHIKRLGESKHILYSTWIVKTKKKIQDIFALIRPAFDQNDNIFIARIDIGSCKEILPSEFSRWIKVQKVKPAILEAIKSPTLRRRVH